MQIRCYRCGWSFAIKQDEAAFALQALEETGGTHYDSNCPRCRHSNRVSLEQLRKGVPRTAEKPAVAEEDGRDAVSDVQSELSESNEDTPEREAEPETESGEPEADKDAPGSAE